MKVLISDSLSKKGIEILTQEKEITVDYRPKIEKELLLNIIENYDILIVRSGTKVTREVIERGKNLKLIGRAGEGVDNIDIEAANEKGIIVMNTPGVNTISAAEHTIALLLSLSRNIPQACNSLKNKKWEREKFIGAEITGKTLGIIGIGKIGKEVAKRAKGLQLKVIGYDPYISEEVAQKIGVELVNFEEILSRSDFLTFHIPLNKETRHLIGKKEFEKMKKGVKIINCARGGIIDENALIEAIKEGKVSAVALDVFEKEPPFDSPIIEMENVICTPHLGASTKEAQEKVAEEIARQVIDFVKYNIVRNAVNFPTISPELKEKLTPYVNLAEKLGSFLGQFYKGKINSIEISYRGEIIEYDTTPLTLAALKGFFEMILMESVNYINASFIAKSRGIRVIENKSSEVENYSNLITIQVLGDSEKKSVSGTLLLKNEMRIVKIDEFETDALPSGYLLVCESVDIPGVIGKIGAILGNSNINIGSLKYSRKSAGEKALCTLNVDSLVPEEVIKKLLKEKEIEKVTFIEL